MVINRLLLTSLITIPFTLIHFWLFQHSLLTSGFTALFAWLLSLGLHQWQGEKVRQERNEAMYYFVQLFLTTLTIKKTIHETYLDVFQRYQLSKQAWLIAYGSNDPLLVLENLTHRFHHPLFAVFVNTVKFYETQGGDVLTLFESVLIQTRLVETRRMEMQTIKKRYFSQWAILWALNLFVLVMAKLVLADLFSVMMTSAMFILLLTTVLLYVPISFLTWLTTYLKQSKLNQ